MKYFFKGCDILFSLQLVNAVIERRDLIFNEFYGKVRFTKSRKNRNRGENEITKGGNP